MAVPALIPWPTSFVETVGTCDLSAIKPSGVPSQLEAAVSRAVGAAINPNGIALTVEIETPLRLEEYRLSVKPDGIRLVGGSDNAIRFGLATIRQLIDTGPTITSCEISDCPRYSWRGALVDVGRHFMPMPDLKRFVDAMARYKLNVLHLHLTEDQGWRVEIKRYPLLTEVGSVRKETMAGHYDDQRFDGTPHGGFYTQDELRDLVAFAADRAITVVPEIELPGHSQAAIAAYPKLGCTGAQLEVATAWGVSENIYNPSDSTLAFLEDVFDEVLDIFPSTFVHVGGDEAPKVQWKASAVARARIQELGLKDEDELQSWFISYFGAYLAEKGRRLVGWDEILEGGLPDGATVMSWRGEEGGIAAATAGHDVVMAPNPFVYFDHYQSSDPSKEPVAIGGCTTVRKVYDYEPTPAALAPEAAAHVLGSEGALWTEYIPTPAQLEYMAFPRLCALAEVLWTPHGSRNFEDFWRRLQLDLPHLGASGVNYRPLDDEQRAPATSQLE